MYKVRYAASLFLLDAERWEPHPHINYPSSLRRDRGHASEMAAFFRWYVTLQYSSIKKFRVGVFRVSQASKSLGHDRVFFKNQFMPFWPLPVPGILSRV